MNRLRERLAWPSSTATLLSRHDARSSKESPVTKRSYDMPISRLFLGLDRPALAVAADYLFAHFCGNTVLDLRHLIVVVPGARAGRRLLEILVDRADADSLTLTPPQITTVGQLPELLYQAKKPFADDLVQQFAWADALRAFDHARLSAVIAERPGDDDAERWLELGRLLQLLHRELVSDNLDFADVVQRGSMLPGFTEIKRWQALVEIRRVYLSSLDQLGLWDRQTARLFAIEHRECRSDRPILLVAAVDLNQSMRQMLEQVADSVTALIYAPQDWADRFDEFGCVIPEAWQDVELPIADETLVEAEGPTGQCEQVARRIAQFEGRFRAEEITIGLADERMVSHVIRQLDECKLPNRYGPGQPLWRTGVYRMLADMAAFARHSRYADFAQLVRNPDIETWLMHSGVRPGWIEEVDDYYNEHLPRQIDGVWLGDGEAIPRLRDAYDRIARLTKWLRGAPRALDWWLPHLRGLLMDVYGGRSFNLDEEGDRRAWKACGAVLNMLGDLARVPHALVGLMRGPEALELLLDRIRSQRIAPAASDAAIELVGWLELPLDDAPALVVTSFNEGFVPTSINADMFLPGGLRSDLGLDDNTRRYARDVYAVATLLAAWRDTTFIVARRDQDDDPLAPSRLLFAAPPEAVARRSLRFFDDRPPRQIPRPMSGGLVCSRQDSAFDVPRPQLLPEPITRMSATSFKTYLACPYRFYLSRVLKLSRIGDDAVELDGAGFGGLAHAVLERFGRSEARDATDSGTVQRELDHLLNEVVRERFGESPGAALLVQTEQLRLRLHVLARRQAEWASQGWRIEHAELSFSDQPGRLDMDGEPMLLTGRIDRIDKNLRTGKRMILDYKTSDSGDSPEKTHRRRGEWIDLQLPLYRHLARDLGIEGPVQLGYVILPKNTAHVGLALAEWTDAELGDADATARDVARKVRDQEFWPPAEPPPLYSEEYAAVCLDGVFGKHHPS